MPADPRRSGLLMILAAALLWATGAVVGKGLFARGVTPAELVQARCTIGAATLGVLLAMFARGRLGIAWRELPLLVLAGAAMAGVQSCYFRAVAAIPVAAAILLQYASAFIVLISSVLFLRERLTRAKIAALALAAGGCFLVAGGYDLGLASMNAAGVAWGLAAAVLFAVYTLLGARLVRARDPFAVLFYALAVAAIPTNLIAPPLAFLARAQDPQIASRILYVALLGTVLPFGLYFAGVRRLGAAQASIAAMAEPVFSALVAYLALGEALAGPQIAGAVAVIGAVVVLERFRGEEGAISRG